MLDASKRAGIEENAEEKYAIFMSHHHSGRQNPNIKRANK
jgi:hypothetical protein